MHVRRPSSRRNPCIDIICYINGHKHRIVMLENILTDNSCWESYLEAHLSWVRNQVAQGNRCKDTVSTLGTPLSHGSIPIAVPIVAFAVTRYKTTPSFAPLAALPCRTTMITDKAWTQYHSFRHTAVKAEVILRTDSVATITATKPNRINKPVIESYRRWGWCWFIHDTETMTLSLVLGSLHSNGSCSNGLLIQLVFVPTGFWFC